MTPSASPGGTKDQRIGVSAIWYPQPFGVEFEWNVGEGPLLRADSLAIESDDVEGGYVQFTYRHKRANSQAVLTPSMRVQHFEDGRKFGRNAPLAKLELTAVYVHTDERTRTGSFPYAASEGADRIGLQLQWNY